MIGVWVPQGLGIFLFAIVSRTALGPSQPPIQWVPGALSLRVKQPGREATHFHVMPRSKMRRDTLPLPQYAFMTWCSVKAQGQLYLLPLLYLNMKNRDSSVGIALGYGLDDRSSRVRFPAGAGNFSLHHRVQNGSGAHLASYPKGTRGCFPGGKAAGA
jgi:hypothetical protein